MKKRIVKICCWFFYQLLTWDVQLAFTTFRARYAYGSAAQIELRAANCEPEMSQFDIVLCSLGKTVTHVHITILHWLTLQPWSLIWA